MAKPTIAFVPGFWEGPTVYSSLAQTLSFPPHSLPTQLITMPSTGKTSPNNGTLQDDVRAIRAQIEPLIEAEKEIILVMHSAGGFLGSNAIEGWGVDARRKDGKAGGVSRLVFLAAGLFPEGTMHNDLPFMEKDVSGPSNVSVSPCPLPFHPSIFSLPSSQFPKTTHTKFTSHPEPYSSSSVLNYYRATAA